ncbi:MAG: hypothetical protein OXF50_22545 [Caldilineaceae bacterium]|nr:hypothetical protein [Caldilineaceae bacterium]
MTNSEPECVALKRRGAARIYQQLAFWQKRNQRMRERQEARLRNESPTETSA